LVFGLFSVNWSHSHSESIRQSFFSWVKISIPFQTQEHMNLRFPHSHLAYLEKSVMRESSTPLLLLPSGHFVHSVFMSYIYFLYIYMYSRWVISSVMSESLWLLSFLSYSSFL